MPTRWTVKDDEFEANNRRSNKVLEFGGRQMTLAQWQDTLNFPRGLLSQRLRIGWSVERALTTPLGGGV